MARLLVSTYEAAGSLFMSSGLMLMFGMLVVSISIMSLLIFVCADDGSGKPHRKTHHGGDGGGAACGGDGGGGGGGGGCGGGGGGGCGGGGGGGC
ncbi:hypothetical protein ACS0TY_018432 [Phlomoides rotata]